MKIGKLNISLFFLILVGIADTAYLTVSHFLGGIRCLGTTDCDRVLLSSYATIYDIPLSLLGFLYYLTLGGILAWLVIKSNRMGLRGILLVSGLGLLFSSWLVYLQYAVILAWCSYCLTSAFTTLLIFLLSLVATIKNWS